MDVMYRKEYKEGVEERGRQRGSHIERQEVEKGEGDGEDLIKSVISCDRTSEAADVHPPLGRS